MPKQIVQTVSPIWQEVRTTMILVRQSGRVLSAKICFGQIREISGG